MTDWCSLEDNEAFAQVIRKYPKAQTSNIDRYVYIDNGANVLAVAHMDTVADSPRYYYGTKQTKYDTTPIPSVNKMKVTSIRLDDRLGVHMILDLLPMMGINVDVLLTDDEEYAQSTALCFVPPEGKKYNWAFSFDRRGVGECVMYQYGTEKDAVKRLEDSGWYFGHGSYSDIADLNIGCVGFNFASGFVSEHTDLCSCQYDGVMYNMILFKKFYQANKDVFMPYTPVPKKSYWNGTKWSGTSTVSSVDADWEKYSYKTAKAKKFSGYTSCSYCGKATSTTWDSFGNDVCDDCYADYVLTVKECIYCGMQMSTESMEDVPEIEDDEFEDICNSCAHWLRENVAKEDWAAFSIKLKKKG